MITFLPPSIQETKIPVCFFSNNDNRNFFPVGQWKTVHHVTSCRCVYRSTKENQKFYSRYIRNEMYQLSSVPLFLSPESRSDHTRMSLTASHSFFLRFIPLAYSMPICLSFCPSLSNSCYLFILLFHVIYENGLPSDTFCKASFSLSLSFARCFHKRNLKDGWFQLLDFPSQLVSPGSESRISLCSLLHLPNSLPLSVYFFNVNLSYIFT